MTGEQCCRMHGKFLMCLRVSQYCDQFTKEGSYAWSMFNILGRKLEDDEALRDESEDAGVLH